MISILQDFLIVVLNPIAKLTSRISDITRSICLQIVLMLFPIHFLLYYLQFRFHVLDIDYMVWPLYVQVSGCFLLVLLIVFSLDRIPQRVEWNKWIIYPFVVCGVLMLLISFLHPVGCGYRLFAVMMVFIYPCLFFVWNNRRDYENLFDPLARALSIVCFVIYIYCFYIAAKGDFMIVGGRCAGLVGNSNLFSFFGAFGSIGAVYMLLRKQQSWFHYLFYSFSLGFGYAIVWQGQSRTCFLSCIACLVVVIFFFIRYIEKEAIRVILVKIVVTGAIVLFAVMLSGLWANLQETAEAENAPASTSEEADAQSGTPQSNTNVISRLTVDSDSTANSYGSGRMVIWKNHMQFFNLLGNNMDEADWEILTPHHERRAHNNFIDMAYRLGVPIGVLFVIIELLACFMALQLLFINRDREPILIFPVMLIGVFFIFSIIEIAVIPFERDAACYFYLALVPLVDMKFIQRVIHKQQR